MAWAELEGLPAEVLRAFALDCAESALRCESRQVCWRPDRADYRAVWWEVYDTVEAERAQLLARLEALLTAHRRP